ncbi:MAG: hypothetical protein M3069_02205 [Chloroflexota bacterium]|nr:hypothetical protein [Chloroflexota bacterium]
MRHAFRLVENDYDYDLLTAVTAYLDCEHYAWLHGRNYSHYEILEDGPTTSQIVQHSKYLGITFRQRHFREYIPPSEFRMFSDKPFPIRTHTRFTARPDGGVHRTVDVAIDVPLVLWPFRRLMEAHLRRYDARVYAEDAAAAARRERYLGKNNWAWAFRPTQFLLHKDAVVEAFRDQIHRRPAELSPEPKRAANGHEPLERALVER